MVNPRDLAENAEGGEDAENVIVLWFFLTNLVLCVVSGCLKEAMTEKELNSKALAYVQKKHNSCLLKSRTLQKRALAARQESHSSGLGSDITSSAGNRYDCGISAKSKVLLLEKV